MRHGGAKKRIQEPSVISFVVYGEPVAQGRPRATTINGHARMYDPAKSHDYKDYVRLVASEYAPEKLLEGAVSLELNVYLPIPKSFSQKKQRDAEKGLIRPTKKPDMDNYIKGICDALNGVIWKDDCQVIHLIAEKLYSFRPRIEIVIAECYYRD